MSDRWARIQLIQLECDRLKTEAATCTDLGRMTAIRREMEVLYASAVDIRRDQLLERINPPQRAKRKRWWRRSAPVQSDAGPSTAETGAVGPPNPEGGAVRE